MVDVARAARVSLGTVSNVVNGRGSVKAPARARVLAAMETLGYRPNSAAQAMRRRNTRLIGFMINHISQPLFGEVLDGAESTLRRAGYVLTVANNDDRAEREQEVLNFFLNRQIDGVIAVTAVDRGAAADSFVRTAGKMPFVLVERDFGPGFDTVLTDHGDGMRKAVHYLHGLGHRRIALITGTEAAWPGRARASAFRELVQELGLAQDDAYIGTYRSIPAYGFEQAHALLSSARPPTAIVAGAYEMHGVLRAIKTLDLRVATDVSVIACGDYALFGLNQPGITAVAWRIEEAGIAAAQLLLERLGGDMPDRARRVLLSTDLVVRDSCGRPRRRSY